MPLKTPNSTSLKWRSEIRNREVASQAATLLLHQTKSDPFPLLKPLLPSPLPLPLFLRILARIRTRPDTSLRFFHFARSELRFQPDIRSHSKLIQTLITTDTSDPDSSASRVLHPILRSEPAPVILPHFSSPRALHLILEFYSNSRQIPNAFLTLSKIRVLGVVPSTGTCNSLLDSLCSSDWISTAWTCLGSLVRTGFEPDSRTWFILCRVLCLQGKIKKAENLLKLGSCGLDSYTLVVDCYSKNGEFSDAIRVLEGMRSQPGFGAYASVLDAGCRFGNFRVVGSVLKELIVCGLLPTAPFLDYNLVIGQFCDLGNAYAPEMFFRRARSADFRLSKGTYRRVLGVFSENGRAKEAMEVYKILLVEGVEMDPECRAAFLSGVCKGEPSEEADGVLKDLIGKGSVPNVSDLSEYVDGQCSRGKWREASDLLNVALEKGVMLGDFCCGSLVRRYCDDGLVDSAVSLHDKVKKSGGYLDEKSYNALLEALLAEKRIGEAVGVFDYMREKNVLGSASFVIMVTALCREKEMRKAMNLHDEMLKLGLKPDDATYKCLISGFV